jgi:hypothetical protein
MRAAIGDTLHIHTHHLGTTEHLGEILEVRGTDGAPPYLVQFRDGTTRLLYPGPDAVIEHPAAATAGVSAPATATRGGSAHPGPQTEQSARRIHTRPGW